MGTVINSANTRYAEIIQKTQLPKDERTELNVEWFLSARFRLRKQEMYGITVMIF